ncbi:MAG: hypothetical protein COB51_02495 [Moraxellaceae bacterium]|nr:MAG: hypothetical protein COB51_02495 [Moraxellaceae bacterium]
MKWLQLAISLAIRNVLRNRRRSFVTILIATVGTAGTLISGGFGLYTYDSLREMSAREIGHLTLAHADYFTQQEETTLALGLSNYHAMQQQLMTNPDIRAALPRVQYSGLISNDDKSTIFMATGIDPEELSMKGPFLTITQGKPLSRNPSLEDDPQVMLGKDLARHLNAQPGSLLTLLSTTTDGAMNAIDVQVRGIFSVGVPEIDKRMLYTHLETAQTLLATKKVSTLSVYLYDTEKTAQLEHALKSQYPQLSITPWWTRAFYYQGVKSLYDRIFSILGGVIAVLVFFSVSNTLSMSVVERTQEIGTLSALGSYPSEIVFNFVLEALVIAISGALIGSLIAGLCSIGLYFSDLQMPPPPGRSASYPLYVYFSPQLALVTSALLILICCTAAWFAARKGANRPIVEALTHV